MNNSQQIDLIQTFNTSHASANTIDQYFNLFGQEGINMSYANGTYSLNGLQAGTVIGYMGNTGANTTGAHAHMSLNASGVQFASVFNQDYSFSLGYNSFFPDSYAVNMSGYSSPNLCNEELWPKVQQYSKDVPIFFDFNSFVKEHEDEYLDKFWSKYKEAQK